MNRDRQVDDVLSPLRDEQAGVGESRSIDRGRVVARMMTVAKDAPRERMQRRLALLASAATLVLALGVVRWVRNAPLSRDQEVREVAISSIGGEVEVTWRGARALRLASGESAHVGVSELEGRGASVRLFAGMVRCRVPQLAPNDIFSVVTRDVHVEVRGAVFIVETSGDGIISVRVDEGVAVVRQAATEVTLTAPQSWTNQRPAEPPRAATPTPPPASSAPPRKVGTSMAVSRGTLDEETRLLRSGLAAERNGDLKDATASLVRLLARFPQSPLAPDARAALARVRSRQRAAP